MQDPIHQQAQRSTVQHLWLRGTLTIKGRRHRLFGSKAYKKAKAFTRQAQGKEEASATGKQKGPPDWTGAPGKSEAGIPAGYDQHKLLRTTIKWKNSMDEADDEAPDMVATLYKDHPVDRIYLDRQDDVDDPKANFSSFMGKAGITEARSAWDFVADLKELASQKEQEEAQTPGNDSAPSDEYVSPEETPAPLPTTEDEGDDS